MHIPVQFRVTVLVAFYSFPFEISVVSVSQRRFLFKMCTVFIKIVQQVWKLLYCCKNKKKENWGLPKSSQEKIK